VDRTSSEQELRAALAADPGAVLPAVMLGEQLLAAGRAEEALAVTAAAAQQRDADLRLWTVRGQALKVLDRFDEAIDAYSTGALLAPKSGVAEHNLAGALGDTQRFAESEAATRRAFAKGLDAPETWLVLGRALQGQARFDAAAAAYREALRRRPIYAEAHGDLAQLLWMQDENASAASAGLRGAVEANPGALLLRLQLARFLEYAGDMAAALAVLRPALSAPADPGLSIAAAQLLVHSDPAAALEHASRAYAAWPGDSLAGVTFCAANLAAGRADVAAAVAQQLHEKSPLDQHVIGLQATAWRILGDPRYRELHDYERVVKRWRIDTPAGWPYLDAYLADLKMRLERLHPVRGHPVGQSLRHGSQTLQGLDKVDDPVIRAFFQAIDGPIKKHIAALGSGADPLRARANGSYRFNGVWSVRLRASGYHTNHLHPKGWISSACYIALPGAVEHRREGWIKFGEPGIPTAPRLDPEYHVKPEPGLLVLFPSYMWHGTVPFSGDEHRLTAAFDLLPGIPA
jgi:tetratricopeptide (TPR) repeat protein